MKMVFQSLMAPFQSPEFESLYLHAVAAFSEIKHVDMSTKSGRLNLLTFEVPGGYGEIHGIEVGGPAEDFLVIGVGVVYLGGFENLRADRAVLIMDEEGASARFSAVADHSADTQRAVEFRENICCFSGGVHVIGSVVGDAEY